MAAHLAILNTKAAKTAITSLVVVVVAVVIMLATKVAIAQLQANTRNRNIDKPANMYAARFYFLFYPWGPQWFGRFINTDEEAVIALAQEVGPNLFRDVVIAYRQLYGHDLVDDVREFLNNEEQTRFFNAVKK